MHFTHFVLFNFFNNSNTFSVPLKGAIECFENKCLALAVSQAFVIVSLPFRCRQVRYGSDFALNYLNGPGDSSTKVEFVAKA